MGNMTWEELLKMDLVGRDLVSVEGDYVYRGPIAKLEIEPSEKRVRFMLKWTAKQYYTDRNGWKKHDINAMSVGMESSDIIKEPEGYIRIEFTGPLTGIYGTPTGFTILPPGKNLNPSSVRGL